jgi:hypothetical protein
MAYVRRVFRHATLNRVAGLSLVCAIAATALPRRAAACWALDPAEVEKFTKQSAEAIAKAPPPTPAMTTAELAAALRKARLPQADVVAGSPGAVEEWSLDFLNSGTYVKATLDGPWHTEVVQFVRQKNHLIPIERGRAGRERVVSDVELSVRSAEAAQRYVQWLLDVTSDRAFWLVSSAEDVPFKQPTRTETDLKTKIGALRQDLESKIEPPRAEESGPGFVVHQDAVVARDLVRYTVKVSKLGLPSIEETTIARDLPLVYVVSD